MFTGFRPVLAVGVLFAIAFAGVAVAVDGSDATIAAPLASTPAASTPSQLGEKHTLLFKYEAGDELVFEQEMSQEMAMQGMPAMGGNEITSTMRWKVLEVADNGDATIEATTERMRGTVTSPAGSTSFDSASEELPDDPTVRLLTAQAGLTFQFVVAPKGDVVSIRGAEQMRDAALQAIPEEQRAMVAPMLEEMFTDEAMENMLGQSFQSFPEEPVGPGDTWDRSMSMKLPMLGTMTTAMTMTLDRFEERGGSTIAVIGWTGATELEPDPESRLPGQFDLTSAQTTGTTEFDVDRGLILSNVASSAMQMLVSMGAQEMLMDMTMDTSFRLVEEDD